MGILKVPPFDLHISFQAGLCLHSFPLPPSLGRLLDPIPFGSIQLPFILGKTFCSPFRELVAHSRVTHTPS
jgi:hypothetical protein